MTSAQSDQDLVLLRGALAANDHGAQYWPPESVEYARNLFIRARGSVPSLERVFQEIGLQLCQQLIPLIMEQRKFKNLLVGYGSPCNYCRADTDMVHWDFALMKVEESRISISTSAATAAVSAITLPLLGAGVLHLPGRKQSGQALHLKLTTCKPCCSKHGNFLGLFMLNEERASAHPLWHSLHEYGFTKFLIGEQMPDKFRFSASHDL